MQSAPALDIDDGIKLRIAEPAAAPEEEKKEEEQSDSSSSDSDFDMLEAVQNSDELQNYLRQ